MQRSRAACRHRGPASDALYQPRTGGFPPHLQFRHRRQATPTTSRSRLAKRGKLADIAGAGVIRHIWMTCSPKNPHYLREAVVRFYWDGERDPSVNVPLGDLFGLGHGVMADFNSLPIAVTRSPHIERHGRRGHEPVFPDAVLTPRRDRAGEPVGTGTGGVLLPHRLRGGGDGRNRPPALPCPVADGETDPRRRE